MKLIIFIRSLLNYNEYHIEIMLLLFLIKALAISVFFGVREQKIKFNIKFPLTQILIK